MPNEPSAAFAAATQEISTQVQADAAPAGGSTPPVQIPPQVTPPFPAGSPAPTPEGQGAPTAPGAGVLGGKFKTDEEATRAHHLLIHGNKALKAENDALLAKIAASAAPPQAPLSPGRVDPGAGPARPTGLDDERWREQYGIDPSDIDARIEQKLAAQRAADAKPVLAMAAADAYMAERYPDFGPKLEDVKAFVVAMPAVRDRVSVLWENGLYAEAMEIGYLAFDNALRATQLVNGANADASRTVDASRPDATLINSQVSGAREPVPTGTSFPQTSEDWDRIRNMKQSGQDAQVRDILFGPSIAHIPELNPGGARR